MIVSASELIRFVGYAHLDAIVVEGYDGVGKGRVLDILSRHYNIVPYRPDYNLWQKHDVRKVDRWKMSGFFWDIYSHFGNRSNIPMLFDRGCISGAVYAEDTSIVDDYKKLLRDMRVMHILVDCSAEDFFKFQLSRNPHLDNLKISDMLAEKDLYTARYQEYLDRAGVDWVIYQNKFDEAESERLANTCAGCGHYSYGICRHPKMNTVVGPNTHRCRLSYDKETQDMEVGVDGATMQCV